MRRDPKRAGIYLKLLFCILFLRLHPGTALRVQAGTWSYGAQLTGAAKDVYDALAGAGDLRRFGDFGTRGRIGLRAALSGKYRLPEASGLAGACRAGAEAFLRDHTEVFWVSGFELSLGFQHDEKSGEMTAGHVILYPVDYYDGIRKEIRSAQAAVRKMVRSVKRYRNRYKKVKAVHDAVLKTVDYVGKGEDERWHHTVTGGLLGKYGHKGVCEAYAKLFDIVCKASGIPSILVTGRMKSADISHMWNYVQMEDGRWYLVDVTNDDQKKPSCDYFLAGSGTAAFAGRVGATHRPSAYLGAGCQHKFRLPVLSACAYGEGAAKVSVRPEAGIALAEKKTGRFFTNREDFRDVSGEIHNIFTKFR